jgi:hypothetical protein
MTGLQAPWPAMGAHGRGRKGNRGEGEGQRARLHGGGREGRAPWRGCRRGIGPLLLLILSVREEEGKKREKEKREKEKRKFSKPENFGGEN